VVALWKIIRDRIFREFKVARHAGTNRKNRYRDTITAGRGPWAVGQIVD